LGQAAAFITIATVINMGLYYAHERIWNNVIWGKKIKDEPELQPTAV
jgi:uncharacterized membrane protein